MTPDSDATSMSLSRCETLGQISLNDRFTATGKPITKEQTRSAWESAALWGEQAPLLPPFRFTDESIIPVVVKLSLESPGTGKKAVRKWSRLGRGMGSRTKVVKMPRREYLKYFARDGDNKYVGTEPERKWTEEELENRYSTYSTVPSVKWVVRDLGNVVFMEKMIES